MILFPSMLGGLPILQSAITENNELFAPNKHMQLIVSLDFLHIKDYCIDYKKDTSCYGRKQQQLMLYLVFIPPYLQGKYAASASGF